MTPAEQPELGIFTTDAALVVRVWDEWLTQATGLAAERVRGRPLGEVIPDLEARGLRRYFHEVLSTGAVQVLAPAFHHYLIPCPPRTPSSRFPLMQQRVTIGPLREDDRIVGAMATIEDVTARLDGERDLAAALESPDRGVRRAAADAIAAAQRLEAPEAFKPLLADEDWSIRRAGVRGLSRAADARFIGSLVDALRDEHRNFSVLSSALKLLSLTEVVVTEPLASLLGHADPDVRIQAALALGEQHDPAAVAPLLEALNDPDPNVRFHAIESLGRLRAADAVDALLEIVESRDFFLAFAAIDALSMIRDPGVVPRLVPLLADQALRLPIIDAMGALGEDDVVTPLVQALNDSPENADAIAEALTAVYRRSEDHYVAGSAVEDAVRSAISPAGTRHALATLQTTEPARLASVVRLLGWLDSPEVDRALAQRLADAGVRSQVVEALVRHGTRVVTLLIDQLTAEDPAARLAAIHALGRVGHRSATAALLTGLQDEPEVLVATAGALAKIGDPAAFEPLLRLVAHPSAAVRQAAIGALNSIGHPDMPDRVPAMLRDADPCVRESAVRIAGYFGYRETAGLMLEAASDPEEAVRRAVLEHLPYLDDPRVVPALVRALEADTPRARAAAARALGRVTEPGAAVALRRSLHDADSWVRYHAARALGERRDAGACDPLVALADGDPATHVRIAAIGAVGASGGAVIGHLQRWAGDPEPEVAGAALHALGKAADDAALRPLHDALRSADGGTRAAAVGGLMAHGSAAAVEMLAWTASADGDSAIAAAAIEGLGAIGSAGTSGTEAAVDALVALLAGSTRREAALAMIARLPDAAIPRICLGLEHAVPEVRRAIVEALARLRHKTATECLDRALADEAGEVREAAILALARLGSLGAAERLSGLAKQDPSKSVRRAAAAAIARLRLDRATGRGPGR